MNNIGFLFAGQGSQSVGMGKSLYDHFPLVKKIFDKAIIDFDIKTLCFEGPEETLQQTQYTQPSMVLVAYAISELLKANGIKPKMVAGLSLGEYSALLSAGVFDLNTALTLTRFRGQVMAEVSESIDSAMMAVLGIERDNLKAVCQKASGMGVVEIVNYNCPGQLVISGEKKAVEKAKFLALENGARRVIPLKVSGPFHSSLLKDATKKLSDRFDRVNFNSMNIPVVFNLTGKCLEKDQDIKEVLSLQASSPVYFEDSVRYMIDKGIDTFIEIGPGKSISGFVKKIDRSKKIYQVEDFESFEKLMLSLKERKNEF